MSAPRGLSARKGVVRLSKHSEESSRRPPGLLGALDAGQQRPELCFLIHAVLVEGLLIPNREGTASPVEFLKKAAQISRVTGSPGLLDFKEEHVAITVRKPAADLLFMAAGLALEPELFSRTAPVMHESGLERLFERVAIHPGEHQDATARPGSVRSLLHDRRNETFRREFEIEFHCCRIADCRIIENSRERIEKFPKRRFRMRSRRKSPAIAFVQALQRRSRLGLADIVCRFRRRPGCRSFDAEPFRRTSMRRRFLPLPPRNCCFRGWPRLRRNTFVAEPFQIPDQAASRLRWRSAIISPQERALEESASSEERAYARMALFIRRRTPAGNADFGASSLPRQGERVTPENCDGRRMGRLRGERGGLRHWCRRTPTRHRRTVPGIAPLTRRCPLKSERSAPGSSRVPDLPAQAEESRKFCLSRCRHPARGERQRRRAGFTTRGSWTTAGFLSPVNSRNRPHPSNFPQRCVLPDGMPAPRETTVPN